MGSRDFQDSNGGAFDEMPYSGESELIELTSSRKTSHQVRDGVARPQKKLFLSERTAGTKMERNPRKRRSRERPKMAPRLSPKA